MTSKIFLFLQGPICPFFRMTANALEADGHQVYRVNLCIGDYLFWLRKNGINYRGKLVDFAQFMHQLINEKNITTIVLLGEQRAYHKIAVEVAQQLNVQIVVTDLGYLRPDWITLELNGISRNSLFPRDPEKILFDSKDLPLVDLAAIYKDKFYVDALQDMLYHFSNRVLKILFPYYQEYIIYNPLRTYLGVGFHIIKTKILSRNTNEIFNGLLNSASKYYVFPLQLEQDYQIRMYSPYSSIKEALSEVVESFAKNAENNSRLVIKIHPLDPLVINWEKYVTKLTNKYKLGDRVIFVYGGSIEKLFKNTAGVITINSTMGIWALNYGVPVLTLGDALYNIEGLVKTRSYLNEFWLNPTLLDLHLRDAFFKLLAATTQLRGGYYSRFGLLELVKQARLRLGHGLVNQRIYN